ncbi:MAG: hypothetical protein EAZ55_06115 [Cytophagales bacterium]|nr:MAG: hypothetical protein EAZ55_06115 [Cytophagales bacterium]
MKKTIVLLLAFFFYYTPLWAQAEASVWYFGNKAGIQFINNQIVPLTSSVINTDEGCATISSPQGKLLFYTDGITLYNHLHQATPNGQELKGHSSSTQSAVVIPNPKNPYLYYLFTIDATAGKNGLCYSELDMRLDGGKGDIIPDKKNLSIKQPVTEKLTAVKHRNGIDYWVIVHGWLNGEFLSYLVTAEGINLTPIISKVGKYHDGTDLNTQGYMKASPDGTSVALALEESQLFELYDFDNATGKLSNPITLSLEANSYPYGIEFSPDGTRLYGSAAGTGKVYQYNLLAGSPDAIKKSATVVAKSPAGEWVGALQAAPDGKIYYTLYKTKYLGVIHYPDSLGLKCKAENNFVNLGEGIAHLGLPTFSQTFFKEEIQEKTITYFDPNKTITIGQDIVLNNVLFEFGKATLQTSSFAELDKIVEILIKDPSLQIEIAGHTDNIGNKSANLTLSTQRAKSVGDYLVSKNINVARIAYVGHGSAIPIANNDTEEGRAKNRRVSFVLKK